MAIRAWVGCLFWRGISWDSTLCEQFLWPSSREIQLGRLSIMNRVLGTVHFKKIEKVLSSKDILPVIVKCVAYIFASDASVTYFLYCHMYKVWSKLSQFIVRYVIQFPLYVFAS